MNQPESPPVSGLVAGKYQLVRLIGRGGMGSVWEARHHQLGNPVAIKFIEPEYAQSAEAKNRFEKEAQAAAKLQSKYAIQIYDHGIQDDRPYIVMELLQGVPLDKHVEMRGSLSLLETAKIFQQVCRGLHRAHDLGIVHRDLKPENIFLVQTPEDDEPIAKVLDFGIAKVASPNNPSITSSTKTGAVLGTPFYMSPEQARGLRNVDHRTDLWSLGVIAFKCVTGKLPFDGESVGDLLVKICTAPVPRPSDVRPGLPNDFDVWFQRALEREPDRRYSSANELSAGLSAAAGMTATPSFNGGHPVSSGATVPQQHGPSGHPGSPPPYGNTPPNYAHTPQAAALTASPFTSSQRVEGVKTSRWKPIVAVALLMGLVGAGGVGLYITKFRVPAGAGTGAGVVAVSPPPPSETPSPTPAVPPSPPAAEPPPAETTTALDKPKPGRAGLKTTPKPPPPAPPAPPTTAVTPPTQTAVPQPVTPPPAEKPKPKPPTTKDPGY